MWTGGRRWAPQALLAAVAAGLLLAAPSPSAALVLGVVAGAALALHTVGVVVVFRAERVVDFAQLSFAIVPAAVLTEFAARRQWLVWLADACSSCVSAPAVPTDPAARAAFQLAHPQLGGVDLDRVSSSALQALLHEGWLVPASYVLSLVLALALGPLLGFALHRLVVRPLTSAPRVAVTLVTLALTQLLVALAALLPKLLGSGPPPVPARPPLAGAVTLGGVRLVEADVLLPLLLLVVLAGLAVLARRSGAGRALRAAADNPERASTLGIDVGRARGQTWVLASGLGGLAGVLGAMGTGGLGTGSAALLSLLAAAAAADLTRVGPAVVAALLLGVVSQSAGPALGSGAARDAVLGCLVIAVIALLKGRDPATEERTARTTPGFSASLPAVPAALRGLPEVRQARAALLVFGAAAVVVLPLILSPSQLTVVHVAAALSVVGLSVLVLTGWTGLLSLGQLGLAGLGAWAAASTGAPFLLALPVGALAGAGGAALLGAAALRVRPEVVPVATLAFALAVQAVLLNPDLLGGRLPADLPRPDLLGLDLEGQANYAWFALAAVGAAAAAVAGLRRSRLYRVLVATRDAPAAAAVRGIDVVRARITALAISGALAGLGGVLLAYALGGVPATSFDPAGSIQIFLTSAVGGLGAVAGPLAGQAYATALTLLQDDPLVVLAATGLPVLLLAVLLPGGLVAAFGLVRNAALVRLADRRGLAVPELRGQAGDRGPLAPITAPQGGPVVPIDYVPTSAWGSS